MINVLLFRGLAGTITSTGLDVLKLKIQKDPRVDFSVISSYKDWYGWSQRIKNFKDPIVLIGHSYGVTSAIRIARESGVEIPLLISFDPSQYTIDSNSPGYNVKKVVNFYQRGKWYLPFLSIGRQKLYRPDGSESGISNEFIADASHVNIDDNQSLHARSLELLKAVKD